MTDLRAKVAELIRQKGSDLKTASLAVGKNHSYLHQFVTRGTPRRLPEEVRYRLAEYLGCDHEELLAEEQVKTARHIYVASMNERPATIDKDLFRIAWEAAAALVEEDDLDPTDEQFADLTADLYEIGLQIRAKGENVTGSKLVVQRLSAYASGRRQAQGGAESTSAAEGEN